MAASRSSSSDCGAGAGKVGCLRTPTCLPALGLPTGGSAVQRTPMPEKQTNCCTAGCAPTPTNLHGDGSQRRYHSLKAVVHLMLVQVRSAQQVVATWRPHPAVLRLQLRGPWPLRVAAAAAGAGCCCCGGLVTDAGVRMGSAAAIPVPHVLVHHAMHLASLPGMQLPTSHCKVCKRCGGSAVDGQAGRQADRQAC